MKAAFFDLDQGLLRRLPWCSWTARRLPPADRFRRRLRRQARALIAAHHWRGHVVVLVTDEAAPWAEMAAQELDADGLLRGSEFPSTRLGFRPSLGRNSAGGYERVGGNPLHHWRPAAIRAFCLRYNFAAGACFGYGALDDDWLWLEALGHPAVAHPSGKLRRQAQLAGWPEVNLNGRSDLPTPPDLDFGSAPPCVTLT